MFRQEVQRLCGLLQVVELRPSCVARVLLGLDAVLQINSQGDALLRLLRPSVHGQPRDAQGELLLRWWPYSRRCEDGDDLVDIEKCEKACRQAFQKAKAGLRQGE